MGRHAIGFGRSNEPATEMGTDQPLLGKVILVDRRYAAVIKEYQPTGFLIEEADSYTNRFKERHIPLGSDFEILSSEYQHGREGAMTYDALHRTSVEIPTLTDLVTNPSLRAMIDAARAEGKGGGIKISRF